MTTIREDVITLMAATSAITSVIGAQPMRAFTLRAAQGTAKPPAVPYIIISIPTHRIETHLRGPTGLENPLIRFDLYGTNLLQLDNLRRALVQMMNTLNGIYRFGTELYEDDTRLYHLVADFSVWHQT